MYLRAFWLWLVEASQVGLPRTIPSLKGKNARPYPAYQKVIHSLNRSWLCGLCPPAYAPSGSRAGAWPVDKSAPFYIYKEDDMH